MTAERSANVYTALLSAQRDFSAVVKNKQNPHLKNFYADLGAVLEAVTEPLANHGLLIVQRFGGDHASPVLITELVHAESGQSITSTLPIICKDQSDPQKLGGAITYARRYSLLALLSLTAEDDDGNTAVQPRPAQRPQTAPPARIAVSPPPPSTRPAVAPVAAGPPPAGLLETIRDDFADPDLRRKSLHAFYMRAETLVDLNNAAEAVKGSGLPTDDLTKAYRWHHNRLSLALAPASIAG